jgi:hypothetical protein
MRGVVYIQIPGKGYSLEDEISIFLREFFFKMPDFSRHFFLDISQLMIIWIFHEIKDRFLVLNV